MLNGNYKLTVFNAFLDYQSVKTQGAGLHMRSNTVLSIQSTTLCLYSQPHTDGTTIWSYYGVQYLLCLQSHSQLLD